MNLLDNEEMSTVSTQYFCRDCKNELFLNQKQCHYCGCVYRYIKMQSEETMNLRDSLMGRQKRKGFKKFMKEFIQGWFPNIITRDNKYGVQKERIIDKEKNEYHETVKDLKTSKVIRDCHEKLTEHK